MVLSPIWRAGYSDIPFKGGSGHLYVEYIPAYFLWVK